MTDKQRQASRANGARSRGPVTPGGKARSAMNALKHGLFAESILLPGESPEQFDALCDDYLERCRPATVAERAAVNDMVAAVWRMRRIRWIEQAEFELALWRLQEDFDAGYYPGITEAERIALAYEELAGARTLEKLERQETRLARFYAFAERRLAQLRAGTPEPEPEPEPGAPVPEPPQPPGGGAQGGPEGNFQNEPGNDLKAGPPMTSGPRNTAPAGPPAAAAPFFPKRTHSWSAAPDPLPAEPPPDPGHPLTSHAAARHSCLRGAALLCEEIRQALANRQPGPPPGARKPERRAATR